MTFIINIWSLLIQSLLFVFIDIGKKVKPPKPTFFLYCKTAKCANVLMGFFLLAMFCIQYLLVIW